MQIRAKEVTPTNGASSKGIVMTQAFQNWELILTAPCDDPELEHTQRAYGPADSYLGIGSVSYYETLSKTFINESGAKCVEVAVGDSSIYGSSVDGVGISNE